MFVSASTVVLLFLDRANSSQKFPVELASSKRANTYLKLSLVNGVTGAAIWMNPSSGDSKFAIRATRT